MIIQFFIPGLPIAKARAKRSYMGFAYIPRRTKEWEEIVKCVSIPHRPLSLPLCPVGLTLKFLLPIPKSLPKRITHHIKRPDLDNLAKSVLDGMRGCFFKDDSQIFSLHLRKGYGEFLGVEVEVQLFPEYNK